MIKVPAVTAADFFKAANANRLLVLALLISFLGVLITCGTEPTFVAALGKFASFLPAQSLPEPTKNYCELGAWVLALTLGALHFYFRRAKADSPQPSKADFCLCLALCGVASIAYLFDPAHIPWQATADECYFVELVKKLSIDPTMDALGMCQWWHWPTGIFVLYGHASQWLGGVSFENLRFLSALAGLAICPLAYLYFRLMFSPTLACAATMLVMFNNGLIAYCRVAQQHAMCVILELVSLTLLFVSTKRGCPFLSYLGGVVAGLGFYVYYPSRIIMVLWLGFMVAMIFFKREQRTKLIKLLAITLVGFAATIAPMFVHVMANYDEANKYTRDRIILIKEGMVMQRSHWYFKTDAEAYIYNLQRGLVTFNSKESDGWGLYENPYIGFADPVTGIFLWVGLLSVLTDVIRKIYKPRELFQAFGFAVNFIILCFVANIAPSFARLFVALPFIAFLAVKGISCSVQLLAKLPFRPLKSETFTRIAILSLAGIATFLSLQGFALWVMDGLSGGEDYGSTMRYIMSRSDVPEYSFYVLTSDSDMYIPWARYDEALETVLKPEQTLKVINSPDDSLAGLADLTAHRPFTVFMLKKRWDAIAGQFKMMYPNSVKHQITTSPFERVGIEVY